MIHWEQVPEGYSECYVGTIYGIVTVARDRSGWLALVTSTQERKVAPRLYHTMQEAKAWVEQQLIGALSPRHAVCSAENSLATSSMLYSVREVSDHFAHDVDRHARSGSRA